MKKYLRLLLVILVCFFAFNINAAAKEKVVLNFFHGNGCPHCAEEEEFLEELAAKYDYLEIEKYEVWYNFTNQRLMNQVAEEFGTKVTGVPFTVIGEDYFKGFSATTKADIEKSIKENAKKESINVVELVKDGKSVSSLKTSKKASTKNTGSAIITVPLIGDVNVAEFSIPVAAVLIGLVDGFNPCAMWVLLFLISTLMGMKDRKRLWILGGTFLLTSALMYAIVMFSIVEITSSISTSLILRNVIAVVAIIGAIVNIYSYIKSRDSGCEVVDDKKRSKIFEKIRKFTAEKSLILALAGVITLALSVNIIELACSAGLPLVFTQLLTINNVSPVLSFIYVLIYILFFLLDDLIIFFIAMSTMKLTGISTKYSKYSHLIGGILLLIIGVLLLVKPAWLMFNFS